VRSVSFVTPRVGEGETPANNWVDALAATDAGAIYMGAGEAQSIAAALIDAGKPARCPWRSSKTHRCPTRAPCTRRCRRSHATARPQARVRRCC
jgi:siroheme synthase